MRRSPAGSVQHRGCCGECSQWEGVHRVSHSRRRRVNRVDNAVHALVAWTARPSYWRMEMGTPPTDALPLGDDVQQTELSELQGNHLADDALHSALHRDQLDFAFYSVELRVDAGGAVP